MEDVDAGRLKRLVASASAQVDTIGLTIEQVPIDALTPDSRNPRQISATAMDALTRSLHEFGFVQPVLVRRANNMVIGGHQRLIAARRLGMVSVPAIFLDVDEGRARLLGLTVNQVSGEWDDELLARTLDDLQVSDLDLSIAGFEGSTLKTLLASLDHREKRDRIETFDVDAAIERSRAQCPIKLGDLWRLDEHVLLCGDATKVEDVDRVLHARRPAMTFTDPPYGVRLGDHGGQQRGSRKRRMANDDLEGPAWYAFVRAWAEHIVARTDGAIYVCMSSQEWPTVSRALDEVGGHWSSSVIWRKDRFTLGRSDYQRGYEAVWYGWREGANHHWCGDRDQSDVWDIDRPSQSVLHPTMKPLELMERAISNSSQPGDLVFDPFAGSGSTLIACERTGRTAALIEIDPIVCQVAIDRWEHFTGRKAILVVADAATEASDA